MKSQKSRVQAKSKGNTAKLNQEHSSKRQTKKQQKEAEEAAKYGEYFDTQEDDKDAAAGPNKDGDRGGASSRDAIMDDDEEGMYILICFEEGVIINKHSAISSLRSDSIFHPLRPYLPYYYLNYFASSSPSSYQQTPVNRQMRKRSSRSLAPNETQQ